MASILLCPKCKKQFSVRIRRRFLQRLIPFSRLYLCRDCGEKYLVIMGMFSLQMT